MAIIQIVALTLLLNFVHSNVFDLSDLEFSPSNQKSFVQGGGKQYSSDQYSDNGSKGSRGFYNAEEAVNGAKGHHDNANHKKHFAEEGGNKNGHNHQDGYYAVQNQGSKGGKGYHFEDHGSYAKGHSTKGHHNVHKLDEFKKNTDFFDEDNDEAFKEKHGGYEVQKQAEKGGYNKGGHLNKGFRESNFGNIGKFVKGSHKFDDKGYNNAKGIEQHFANDAKFAKNQDAEEFKKYGFHLIAH